LYAKFAGLPNFVGSGLFSGTFQAELGYKNHFNFYRGMPIGIRLYAIRSLTS